MRFVAFAGSIALLLGIVPVAAAQQYPYNVDTKPVRGFMPTADQLTSPVDSIDPVSGKLHLEIPLASLPRGRGDSGFDVKLVYDSHLYDINVREIQALYGNPAPVLVQELDVASNGGWSYNFLNFRLTGETRVDLDAKCATDGPLRVYRYRIGLPDGSAHILHLKSMPNNDPYDGEGWFGIKADGRPPVDSNGNPLTCWTNSGWLTNGRLTYFTTDGSYLKLEVDTGSAPNWTNSTWTLYFPDGRRAEGKWLQIEALYDANSNKIVFENTCDDAQCWKPRTRIFHEHDAGIAARRVEIAFNTLGADANAQARTDTVTGPGPNGPLTWTLNWQRLNIGNDGRKYKWGEATQQELTNLAYAQWVVGNIQLPASEAGGNALKYEFTYGQNTPAASAGYGELRSMTTPDGAIYTYAYRFDGASCLETDPPNCPYSVDLAEYNWVKQRTITGSDIASLTWTYDYDHGINFKGTVQNPDGGSINHWFYPPGDWKTGLVYRIDEPHGAVRERVWAQNKAYPLTANGIKNPNNPYIQRESVTAGDAAGVPSAQAVTDYSYDKNGNVLGKFEYDMVPYGQSPQILRRLTTFSYYVAAMPASDTSNDLKAYWQPHYTPYWNSNLLPRSLNAVRRREIADGTGIVAATEFEYDAPYTRGNVKKEYQWDNTKGAITSPLTANNSVVFSRDYDPSGNLTEIYEPLIRTHIEYDGGGNVPRNVYYAYQSPAQRRFEYVWNANMTVFTSRKDLDNSITTTYEYDNVGRAKSVTELGLRRTSTSYNDVDRKVTVLRDLRALGDGKLQTVSHYDRLGRVKLVQQSDGTTLNSDPEGIKVTTLYLHTPNAARRVVTSSPYRTMSDPTLEWTCTQYDQLDRVMSVAMFTGSTPPADCQATPNRTGITYTAYDADWISVLDPMSKLHRMRHDAQGRTIQVTEDPFGFNFNTHYVYDGLDNPKLVCQNGTISNGSCSGGQSRTFGYTSLGRLASAANPETAGLATTYTYWDSGDLKTRTDPRGATTTFGYDELHRLEIKTYTNSPQATPTATYEYYETGSASRPNIGQLKKVTAITAAGATIASTEFELYDDLGRVQTSRHTIDGYPGSPAFSYTYLLNNTPATVRYPSGHIVNYSVDDAGRVEKVETNNNGTITKYADLTAVTPLSKRYTPDGRMTQMQFGNGLWEAREYRTPGTATVFKLGTASEASDLLKLEYNYHATQNNGNLVSHSIAQPGRNWKQSYAYDGVNRLKCAAEALNTAPSDPCTQGTWRQTFGYDAYGNRWVSSTIGLSGVDFHEPIAQSNFDPATNRLYVSNSSYDLAGNQKHYAPWNMEYDAENRMVSATNTPAPPQGTGSFVYDADGRRVKKTWTRNGVTNSTYYVYNALGQLATEYSTQPAMSTGTTYLHPDMLGSVRMVTGEKPPNGSAPVLECYDYVPFGRMLNNGDNARNTGCYPLSPDTQITSRLPQKFTGKERDQEGGLDFFGARYLSAAQGRFTSPDPHNILTETSSDEEFTAFISNPQNWNRYAYVLNNPLSMTDPDGRCPTCLIWLQQLAQRAAPYANRAALAAQQYGRQAYIAATRFFSSPAGQEATATVAELVTGSQLPYGFSNAAQFQQFGKAVSSGLREVAGEGAQAFLAGSAITGKSFATGAAFDVGRQSDFDVALVAKELLTKAKDLGIELRGQGMRTGPLGSEALKALGLDELAQRLSQQAGRQVNFMIYQSEEELRRRGAPYRVLQ